MFDVLLNRRIYIIITADLAIFTVSFVGAYLLRFDFFLTTLYAHQIRHLLPIVLPGKIVIFFLFGLYRSMWRYTSLDDLLRLVMACLVSMFFCITLVQMFPLHNVVPRSIYPLDFVLTFIMSGGLRVVIRLYFKAVPTGMLFDRQLEPACNEQQPKHVVIIGAGSAGDQIFREIHENARCLYDVLGFLDDDPSKWRRSMHGKKVFGSVQQLPALMQRKKIDEVLIAIPTATGPQMRRINNICKQCCIRYRTLPELGAIIDGRLSINSLRDVQYEDLLRREPTKLNISEISQYLQGKRVLITGAGGSIGSELCRQIIRFNLKELILLDACELNLYKIQMEFQHDLQFFSMRCVLGQVQDQELMENVFTQYKPQLIFHAAAYKHVPMLELNPWQAVSNNVLGTRVVANLAIAHQVERFVLVSTDKAVRPTNVMGASKRLTELLAQSRNGNGTRFMVVRFGNVIGSSGSVLPLFRHQIEHGGPVTVTHPEVTRFFMTIPEAAQLILQAGGLGKGGEIFLLKMGTPVKIAQIAEEVIRLSGREPGKDVEIVYTGLRPGEKLYEELITEGENIVPTKHEKIMVLRANGWNGQESQEMFRMRLDEECTDLHQVAAAYDGAAIKRKLAELIPEYHPSPITILTGKPTR